MSDDRGQRWQQRPILATCGLLLATGCVSAPTVQEELRQFHGGSVEALVAEFGQPAEVLGRRNWGRQRYTWQAAGQPLPEDADERTLKPGRRFHASRECILRASVDESGQVLDAGVFGRDC